MKNVFIESYLRVDGGNYPVLWQFVEEGAAAYAAKFPRNACRPSPANPLIAATIDGEYAGFIAWQIWENSAHVGLAYVAPEFRRKGLYRRMLARLERHAQAEGLAVIRAWVVPQNAASIAAHSSLLGEGTAVLFEKKVSA